MHFAKFATVLWEVKYKMKALIEQSAGAVQETSQPTIEELTEFLIRFIRSEPYGLAQIEGQKPFQLTGDTPVDRWIKENKDLVMGLCKDYCRNALTWRCFHRLQQHRRFGRRFGSDVYSLAEDEGLSRQGFYRRANQEPKGLAEYLLYS